MKIYNYHPEYKHLTGVSIADESPLEPGVWLISAYATEVEPPTFKDGEIPVFNGEVQVFNNGFPSYNSKIWNIIEDLRGIYYDMNSKQSIENYNPLKKPENSTKEVPPEVPEGKVLNWNNGWVLEDIPAPPELTPAEKLQSSGLTIEELKDLLGLN